MASLANIDRSYMSSVERGLRNVSVLNIARIAGALGVPVWELFYPQPRRTGGTRRRLTPDRSNDPDPAPAAGVNPNARLSLRVIY